MAEPRQRAVALYGRFDGGVQANGSLGGYAPSSASTVSVDRLIVTESVSIRTTESIGIAAEPVFHTCVRCTTTWVSRCPSTRKPSPFPIVSWFSDTTVLSLRSSAEPLGIESYVSPYVSPKLPA